eukprot:TRINITY_DN23370_c0_g1_i3.p1 TRINITY_DN23370_c0_g1~~TRINITY_DN23370_c0_g1_i3.p1  ORF type:complete len:577 (+),score=93.37 TRINITY_DN23370_c0_g1_i3:40-1770(+)
MFLDGFAMEPDGSTQASCTRRTQRGPDQVAHVTEAIAELRQKACQAQLDPQADTRQSLRSTVTIHKAARLDSRLELFATEERDIFERVVLSTYFDLATAAVIVANTVLVGIEQTYELQRRRPKEMFVVESAFLIFYIMEILLRFRAFGVRASLRDGWVVIKFRPLWMLMQGLLNSAQTMLTVMFVLSVIVYVFACVGVDLVGGHPDINDPGVDDDFRTVVEMHFSDLFSAMLTILSFLVFDSVRQVYWPLVLHDPMLMIYFLTVFLSVGVVLANLITAVMVNGAIEQASHNREAKMLADKAIRAEILHETMEVFRSLDTDASGIISREEVQAITDKDAALLESLIKLSDPVELFDVLDEDDSGEVDMEEFLKVVERVACHPGESIQFLRLGKALKQVQISIIVLSEKIDRLARSSTECEALRADRFQLCPRTNSSPLPACTPVWASMVYEDMMKEFERSTAEILRALQEDGKSGLRFDGVQNVADAKADFAQPSKCFNGRAGRISCESEERRDSELAPPQRPPSLPPCEPSPSAPNDRLDSAPSLPEVQDEAQHDEKPDYWVAQQREAVGHPSLLS